MKKVTLNTAIPKMPTLPEDDTEGGVLRLYVILSPPQADEESNSAGDALQLELDSSGRFYRPSE